VRAALAGRAGFTSAQDLHAEPRSRGEWVGLTTVYRRLQLLADTGDVAVLRTPDGESMYRLCETGSLSALPLARRIGVLNRRHGNRPYGSRATIGPGTRRTTSCQPVLT
jgi:Fur family ferric uptake transcriptional regulator